MNIQKMMNMTDDIKLYEKGTSVMWTDEYISGRLLELHTDTTNDIASRSGDKIDSIVEWILHSFGRTFGDVLDIGCGPGLYAQKFAQRGYKVTGIDFSSNSIDYAVKSAKDKNLDIDYICMNYLDMHLCEKADLITMIYCDFCVLNKAEQNTLLEKIYRALRPGGMFVFDVYNEKSLKNRSFTKVWEFCDDKFWREAEYLNLSSAAHYEDSKAVLSQNIIYDESGGFDVYRFWEHYFAGEDIIALFEKHEFSDISSCGNILRSGIETMEDGITFYTAVK